VPDPTPLDVDPVDPGDDDFVNEALGAESSATAEERAARCMMRLLGRKTGLSVGAIVVFYQHG
jgi:hypothetical protein